MATFHCKYCGSKSASVAGLTAGNCLRHPAGANKGRHTLYEGSEKAQYVCRLCGAKSASIVGLTAGNCQRHPTGANKSRHEPAA
ncbi:hypothetical protein EJV47_03105 [Hymenobacter gummosus]|uniref:Uncharacterized protein n=1 Tax=Hymenobacter gummosus TaxID=1776032 RepID=A0A3S0K986_9BACT|nr:hypothetical protein EJV47_03105 [Hymenobacter gummosus]